MHAHIKVLLMNAESPLYLHKGGMPQTAEAAAESTGIFFKDLNTGHYLKIWA